MCGRAEDVVDGADVVALLLLALPALDAAPLLEEGCIGAEEAADGEGFAPDDVAVDAAVDVDVLVLLASLFMGTDADDVAALFVVVVEFEVGAEAGRTWRTRRPPSWAWRLRSSCPRWS